MAQIEWTPKILNGYCAPGPYDVVRPENAVRFPSGVGKRRLESGAVATFRQGSDAIIIQRKHKDGDAISYEILGSGATIDASQVCTDVISGNNKIKRIDVIIDGDKNRVISPIETYVAMKGNKNIIGSGTNDDNIHIVSADNIFAKTDPIDIYKKKIKFGTLTSMKDDKSDLKSV